MEKIEKAKAVKDELVSLAREYFKREEVYVKKAKLEVAEALRAPEREMKDLENGLLEAKRLVEAGLKDTDLPPEILTIEKKLSDTRNKKDNALREAGKLEGEISYIKKAIEKEEKSLAEAGNQMVALREVETLANDAQINFEESARESTLDALKSAFGKIRELFAKFVKKHKESASSSAIDELKEELRELDRKKKSFDADLSEAKEGERKLLSDYEFKRKEFEKAKDETREAEKEIFKIIARQNEVRANLDKLKVREREVASDEEALTADMKEVGALAGIEALNFNNVSISSEFEERSIQHDKRKLLERLKIRLEETGVSGGDDILKEHKDTEERDIFLAKELMDLEKASEDLGNLIKELEEKLNAEFREGVAKINTSFKEFFALMFGGGNAGLKISKEVRKKRMAEEGDMEEIEEEPEEGIDIEVSLPHKKIKGLMMLSGGERALTSIALLFAITQVNPPPFVILDETDAALDEANSRKYGDMVENRSKHSQLILITHNRETMSRAGVLYGITMGKDAISKLLSISFADAVEVAK